MAGGGAEFGPRNSREGHEDVPPRKRIGSEAKTPSSSSEEVPPLPKEDPDPTEETPTGEFPGGAGGGRPGTGAPSVPAGTGGVGEAPPMRKP
jgi:hypothetical protein